MTSQPPATPSRHKPLTEAQRWAPFAQRLLGQGAKISSARWELIGAQLLHGDPLADELVAWMRRHDMRQTRPLVDRALRGEQAALEAMASLDDVASVMRLFKQVEQPPGWVDFELIERGGRFLDSTHPAPYYVLRNMGLLAGYTWSDLNYPLMLTGALRSGATRRVAQTMSWFSDTLDPHALRPHQGGYLATLRVRLLHATVRAHLLERSDWDIEERGLPINQTDMAATWLAFSAVLLIGLRLLGVRVTAEESHAVMHLLNYACWLMGVDLSWLTDDEGEARLLLFHILSTYRGPDETSIALARALAEQTRELSFSSHAPLDALLWRLERSKHLGTAHLFLGPRGMMRLGLSPLNLPWYPLSIFGYNMARSSFFKRFPSLQDAASRGGLEARQRLVAAHWSACKK